MSKIKFYIVFLVIMTSLFYAIWKILKFLDKDKLGVSDWNLHWCILKCDCGKLGPMPMSVAISTYLPKPCFSCNKPYKISMQIRDLNTYFNNFKSGIDE